MQVSPARPAVAAFYAAYGNHSHAAPASAASEDGTRRHGDSVTISDAARQAVAAEQARAQQAVSKVNPVEMYQLPSWYADYGIEVANILGVSADWHAEKDSKMLAASAADRGEFMTLIDQHYREVLDTNGIKSVEEHYQGTILNREQSESLRQQLTASMQGDGRLLELAAKMGKWPVPG